MACTLDGTSTVLMVNMKGFEFIHGKLSFFIIGWVTQIRSHHQFDPTGIKKINCRRRSASTMTQTSELNT